MSSGSVEDLEKSKSLQQKTTMMLLLPTTNLDQEKKGIHSNEVLQHANGSWRDTFDLSLTRYVRSIGLLLVGISYEYRHTVI